MSIALNSIAFSVIGNSLGGIICVIKPLSSWLNASGLKPTAFSDFAPKLEFELVIDISPPVSTTKCSAKPIAKTETACITALLVHFIWVFLYAGLNIALESELSDSFPETVLSSYTPVVGLYFTNALSSLFNPIPVNWATTIDLNPVALDPSAWRPFIPNTDLNEQLKIYGDADVTVSDWRVIVEPVTEGNASRGEFWTSYLNWVLFTFSATTYFPLYPATLIPSTLNGVSTSRPATAVDVVTVIVSVGIVPLPALILVIPTDSPVEPTIRYSSTFGWISIDADG